MRTRARMTGVEARCDRFGLTGEEHRLRIVKPAVYILASKRNGTLYIGVTGDIAARVSVHQQDLVEGFTRRHGVHHLVHYECFETMLEAIAREKKLKKIPRASKIALIETSNPLWHDLTPEIEAWRS